MTNTEKKVDRLSKMALLAMGAEDIGSEHECEVAARAVGRMSVALGWDVERLWSHLEMDREYKGLTWGYVVDGRYE